jgi:hypothetical protein
MILVSLDPVNSIPYVKADEETLFEWPFKVLIKVSV